MKRLIAFCLALGLAGTAAAQQRVKDAPFGMLRGLDKVSGVTTDFTVARGTAVQYGRLIVTLHECRSPTSNAASDAFALLSVEEKRDRVLVFQGWMVASSPALNALDHPRYDVWVLRCSTSKG